MKGYITCICRHVEVGLVMKGYITCICRHVEVGLVMKGYITCICRHVEEFVFIVKICSNIFTLLVVVIFM
jgi:hypothetical protein